MAVASAIIAAGIGVAGSVYAGSQANSAAKKSAAAQQAATEASLAEQRAAREQAERLNAPYTQAGYGALDAINQQYGLGTAGTPDWNTYINANHDVRAIQDVLEGKAPGTQDQLNFIDGFRRSGLSNVGEYHNQVVGGRQVPTTGGTPAGAAVDPTAPKGYTMARARPNLDVSLNSYIPSPDYQFQLSEGTKNVNSGYAAKNLLQSGAAMKALQEFGQNLALGDYDQWRNYTTGVWNNENAYWENDRNYLADRYDTKTNNLFKIAGLGQASANNTAAAGSSYANNATNLLTNQADNQSSYYNTQAQNNSDMVNSVIGGAQGLLKGSGTSYGASSTSIPGLVDYSNYTLPAASSAYNLFR